MPKRQLIQVVREMGVGMDTIFDFLTHNGYILDKKPNSKIDEEMYVAIKNEFRPSDFTNDDYKQLIGRKTEISVNLSERNNISTDSFIEDPVIKTSETKIERITRAEINAFPLRIYFDKTPERNDTLTLFEHCINRLVQKMPKMNIVEGDEAFKGHSQWANLIYGIASSNNLQYLSKVKDEYSTYLINKGSKYKWNFQRVYYEHPQIFNIDIHENAFGEMLHALRDEIYASQNEVRNNTYLVRHLEKYYNGNDVYVALLDLEENDDPKFFEDLPIIIKIGIYEYDAKVLDFDSLENRLYFRCEKKLSSEGYTVKVLIDPSWIIEKIRERIENSKDTYLENQFIPKMINGNIINGKVEYFEKFENEVDLIGSQKDAYEYSLNNKLSIIWGPPGTGKSHTLARIVRALYKSKEKTLITCIANIAVDEIAEKTVKLLEEKKDIIGEGEILRIGYIQNPLLLKTEYLFPDNDETRKLRSRILEIKEKLNELNREEKIKLKEEKQKLNETLKVNISEIIHKSTINFATISKFFVDGDLNGQKYENLIIDEASMVSIPHLIGLCMNVFKRVIIVGDFRQLSPVVLSQSRSALKWLHRDIFKFCGIDTKSNIVQHINLIQLLVQHRSHEKICSLINKPFYNNALESTNIEISEIAKMDPFGGKVIKHLKPLSSNKTEKKNGSRLNHLSAMQVVDIIKLYHKSSFPGKNIGIITPYRQQVKLIKSLLIDCNFEKAFENKLKVGTIHSFQGSEADIIIFDIVDSGTSVGKLFKYETGKRLVNVAISRAKHKLIICGDLEVFENNINVDMTVQNIFARIKRMESNG